MNLNKNVSSQVGLTIIGVLALCLVGMILYSWDWAGNYLADIVSSI